MTNQQGAPEALRPIQRFNNIYGLMNQEARGLYVRYEDHVAALIEAQQPAPSAAVALSDDLRDGLVAISAAIADQDDRAAQAMLREILAAPQPSTTPPADSHPAPVLLSDEELCQIEEPYLLNFRIPLGGQYDFARAVEKAVLAKTYGTQAPQPSPTPQAASSAVLKAIRAANMQLVRTGDDEFMLVTYKNAKAQCDGGKCGIGGYCDDCPTPQADSQPAHQWDTGYPPLPRPDLYDSAAGTVGWSESALQGFVDADRAARAPADSVTAPAAYSGNLEQELAMLIRRIVSSARRNCEDGSNVLKLANEAWAYLVRKGLNGSPLRDAGIETAPTPPAQAADSVLEDAARLERERICAAIKAEDDYCIDQGDYMLDSDDCIKIVRGEWVRPDFAVDAARKKGANHDHT